MTLLIAFVMLSILVLVHELGHFMAAKKLGIRVEEFAMGLPFTPPLLKFKRNGTQYAIYPVLFGGFVKLYGEEEQAKEKDSYWSRSKKQRAAVLLAGVVMNTILAFAGFAILYGIVGVPTSQSWKITLSNVVADSPAAKAGLLVDDRIVGVEGKPITNIEDFSKIIDSWKGLGVNLTIERGKGIPLFEGIVEQNIQQTVVNVVPRANPPVGQGALGVEFTPVPYVMTNRCDVLMPKCFGAAIGQGVSTTGLWIGRVFEGLRDIGKSLAAGKAPQGVAGPVGIVQLTGLVAKEGILPLVQLLAVLSINLAVFNVLPIPAMDGGRLFFVYIEAIFKKRVSSETELKVNNWGMAFLIGLMILISFQDVLRLLWPNKFFGQ